MIPSLSRTAKFIVGVIGAILLIWAVVFVYNLLTGKPKAEARLGRNTTEAALESGRDAVQSVGEVQASSDATDATTRQNAAEIHSAPGSDAKVASTATDAGIRALCRRASARNDPKCAKP